MKKYIFGVLICSVSALCFANEPKKEDAQKWEVQAKKDLELMLVDPDSAKYKMLAEGCGYINSKNSMGGYTGFKKFRIWKHNGEVMLFTEQDKNFSLGGWQGECNQPKTM